MRNKENRDRVGENRQSTNGVSAINPNGYTFAANKPATDDSISRLTTRSLRLLVAVILPLLILAALHILATLGLLRYALIVNVSDSVPQGVYGVKPCEPNQHDLVLFYGHDRLRTFAEERGYIKPRFAFIKPIAATAGDHVCIRDDGKRNGVWLNGDYLADRLRQDNQHRNLPLPIVCRTLGQGELFTLSQHSPYSFDSRYFGVIKADTVSGCLSPIMIW